MKLINVPIGTHVHIPGLGNSTRGDDRDGYPTIWLNGRYLTILNREVKILKKK